MWEKKIKSVEILTKKVRNAMLRSEIAEEHTKSSPSKPHHAARWGKSWIIRLPASRHSVRFTQCRPIIVQNVWYVHRV